MTTTENDTNKEKATKPADKDEITQNKGENGSEGKLSRRACMLLDREPVDTGSRLDNMQVIFQRAIAAILGSRGIHASRESYDYISILAEEHLMELCSRLHKLSGIQRRHNPSITDVAMLLRFTGIRVTDLENQKDLKSRYVDALNQLRVDPTEEVISEEAKPFFNTPSSSLNQLVPNKKKPGAHVPSWMPSFPPDHTFMASPQYTKRVTDPRQLREKIVQEGRLAEEALRRLTETVRVGDDSLVQEDDDIEMKDNEELIEVELDRKVDEKTAGEEPKPEDDTIDDKKVEPKDEVKRDKDEEAEEEEEGEEEDEPPVVMSLPSFNQKPTTSTEEESSLSPTSTPAQPEEKPKKLSLKISLGGNVIKATSTSQSSTATTTMTTSERNKYDPFGVKTTSKRFDVVDYAKKRIDLNERREQKQRRLEERKKEEEEKAPTVSERLTGNELIDHEFDAAFASVQRRGAQKSDGLRDSGIINWDSKRYIFN